jgi:polyhydroxyalkanoate synthase subunit PhaE
LAGIEFIAGGFLDMADNKTGTEWLGDWQALQQRYWTSMGEMARQVGAQGPQAQMPQWHEGLEIWSRAFQGGGNGHAELVERALEHGKAYLDMLQRMGGLAARPGAQTGLQDWSSAFSELVKGMPQGLGAAGIDAMQGARGVEQMMADIQPMLSMFLGEAKGLLGMQPFGMAREHQERVQALAAAALDYQQASARYNALLASALRRGVEIFEGMLAERSEPGRHIESAKALYDLWIDAAEAGYAEVAMSQDFQDAYAELVNNQMRVRQGLQDQVERLGAALGMPTRSEINSVHRKLAALKRSQADSDALRDLAAEVARLRARVDGDAVQRKKPAKGSVASRSATAKPVAKKAGTSRTAVGKAGSGKSAAVKAPKSVSKSAARSRKASPRAPAKGAAASRKRKLSR